MISLPKSIDIEKNYNKLIWGIFSIVVVLKIALMGLFSSDYQNQMFIPFIETFLNGKGNPYDFYYANGLLSSFPYPPIMLLIESIGGIILQILNPKSIFLRNIIFKLPLLFFDMIGFAFLKKICQQKIKYIFVLYFLSPILLFSTYMHGQLDIIPTVLLIVSLYHLIRNENSSLLLFSVFLALAIGAKFHIVAAVPIVFLYLYKRRGLTTTIFWGGITAFLTTLLVAPFWGEGFWNYVIMNKEQSVITKIFLDYDTTKLFIPILAVVLIYLKVYQLKYMNRNLLFCIMGVLFAVFLICIPPMPGWFMWIVPFITIYFIFIKENKYKMLSVYLLFNVIYILYFIFCHRTEFVDLYFLNHSLQNWKINNANMVDIVFTLLVSCLLMLVFEMYQFGVASNSLYKRMNLPFTIGIAGDSGVGKSELLSELEELLGAKNILYLEGDGDHRWKRGDSNWEKYTHLDPNANYLYRQAEDIKSLREGSTIRRADYDHNTGTFTARKRIVPKPYVVLCGLHALYLPQTRKALDLKIYMDTDETLRRFWKIQRDTGKRGYSADEIIRQIEKRIPDAQKYIYPQKEFADLRIIYFDKNLKDCFDVDHKVTLSLKLSISISINIEDILISLEQYGVRAEQRYCEDLKHQDIVFDGADLSYKNIDFSKISKECIAQFDDLFATKICWQENINGILQLFILVVISAKLRGE